MSVGEIADATVPVEFQAAFPDGFERQGSGRFIDLPSSVVDGSEAT